MMFSLLFILVGQNNFDRQTRLPNNHLFYINSCETLFHTFNRSDKLASIFKVMEATRSTVIRYVHNAFFSDGHLQF